MATCLGAALAACGGGGGGGAAQTPTNVLLIVLDDVGVDMLGSYGINPTSAPTPTLDALVQQGVRFTSAYTQPLCSPTRAAILTGRYGFRTGIGDALQEWLPEHSLALWEVALPEVFQAASPTPIATSAVGKWHLGSRPLDGFEHPTDQGFDYYRGTYGNLFFGQSYFAHSTIENGVEVASQIYCTTEQVDDALARAQAMPQPWFVYLSFNACHKPFHVPPQELHTYALAGNPDDTPNAHYCAAMQALDTELGRLLAALDPAVRANTTIILIGDNGTPNEAVVPPSIPGESKGSLYEGGVRVPLIVSGKHVRDPGTTCDALVNSVDLFPTIAELLGVDARAGVGDDRPLDGVSMLEYLRDSSHASLRSWVFADKFTPNGFGAHTSQGWMIRDARWKLVRRVGGADEFFDMQGQILEGPDLLSGALTGEQQAAYDALAAQLAALLAS